MRWESGACYACAQDMTPRNADWLYAMGSVYACRFCQACRDADPRRVITMKPPARKSARKRVQRDYAGLNAGNEQDPDRCVPLRARASHITG